MDQSPPDVARDLPLDRLVADGLHHRVPSVAAAQPPHRRVVQADETASAHNTVPASLDGHNLRAITGSDASQLATALNAQGLISDRQQPLMQVVALAASGAEDKPVDLLDALNRLQGRSPSRMFREAGDLVKRLTALAEVEHSQPSLDVPA